MNTSPVGPWPGAIPVGSDRAAVWLDGSMASAAIAHWLTQAGTRWVALIGTGPGKGREVAHELAEALGVRTVPIAATGPVTSLAGWATAGEAAVAADCPWLVLPATLDATEPPLPLRLHAAEAALQAYGLSGLWAPLLGWEPLTIARLSLALGVPFALTWDCMSNGAHAVCGSCAGCVGRHKAFSQLGMPDPRAHRCDTREEVR
jgi:hypothetical protein